MNIDRGDKKLATISDPPEQESPKHIINALNNDCIQEILRRLKNITDFLSAAEVCTLFQENARQCFPSIYNVFYSTWFEMFDGRFPDTCKLSMTRVLPVNRVQSFLSIFGDFIEKIAWGHDLERWDLYYQCESRQLRRRISKIGLEKVRESDENSLRVLADHCGKTVNELQIMYRFIDFNIMHKFQAVEKLEIEYCCSGHVETSSRPGLFPKLKSLKVMDVSG